MTLKRWNFQYFGFSWVYKILISDSSISRVQSAPVKLDPVDVVRPVAAGAREEPIKPSGGLAAVK